MNASALSSARWTCCEYSPYSQASYTRALSGEPVSPDHDRPLTLARCGQCNGPLILDPSPFHPSTAFDVVPAQLNLALKAGGVELDSARHGEIDHKLFARIGQAVGSVGRPVCQKLIVWRAMKEIKCARDFSRTPHHPQSQLAVAEVLFVEARRGTAGENVAPEPFRRLPAGPNSPLPSLP